jgi:hypothetical protein
LADFSLLRDNNAKQDNSQYWPDDDEDPNVDLLVSDSEYPCPIDQYIYTPIKDLIHHFLPPHEMDFNQIL